MSLFGKSKSKNTSSQAATPEIKERGLPPAPKTIVSSGAKLKGDIISDDPVTVDGELKGTMVVKNHMIVGKTGTVEANIKVQTLQVFGTVKGDVIAKGRVSIEQSGSIEGNVSAGKLAISEGAIFRGNIDMSEGSSSKMLSVEDEKKGA